MTGKHRAIRVTSAPLARPRRRTAAWNAGAAPYISNESDGAGDLQSPFPPATWVKVCPAVNPGMVCPAVNPGEKVCFVILGIDVHRVCNSPFGDTSI
jgi:hypothetical protein